MSMICWMLGLSSAQMSALRATPSLASDLAWVAQDKQYKDQHALAMSSMTLKREPLPRLNIVLHRASMERIPALKEAEAQNAQARGRLESIGPFEDALYLQKSWHILHYLFTGHIGDSIAPGDTLMTGEELGKDLGYGPPRLHEQRTTEEFARFLKAVDLSRLLERVNYREMSRIGVYAMPMGSGSDAEHEDELRREVESYFPRLRDYVAKMAEKRDGLLIWLS